MADTESTEASKRTCLGADCQNEASDLQCPTCLKAGVQNSVFCSQECFKKNWVSQTYTILRYLLTPRQNRHSTGPSTRRLALRPTPTTVPTIHFPPFLTRDPCKLFIHSLRDASFLNRLNGQTGRKPAFQGRNSACIPQRLPFWTPRVKKQCAKSAD